MHQDTQELNDKFVALGLQLEYNHDAMKDRMDFLLEELNEMRNAHHMAGVMINGSRNCANERADMLDALVDLVVVAMGTAYQMGWNFEEAWKRVHHANMLKTAVQSEAINNRDLAFDLQKPEGWTAPYLQDLVTK